MVPDDENAGCGEFKKTLHVTQEFAANYLHKTQRCTIDQGTLILPHF